MQDFFLFLQQSSGSVHLPRDKLLLNLFDSHTVCVNKSTPPRPRFSQFTTSDRNSGCTHNTVQFQDILCNLTWGIISEIFTGGRGRRLSDRDGES